VRVDLRTIGLRGGGKEPRRRGGSALPLAEDVRRFQAGEPIQARPVGALERAWKWTKRRPALAALVDLTMCARVRDLTPLQDLPLRELFLGRTEASDLTPIRKLRLTTLEMNRWGRQRDLSLLRGMPLRSLDLSPCAITDLTPLEGLRLESLWLAPGVQPGMEVVRRMATLKQIHSRPVAEFRSHVLS